MNGKYAPCKKCGHKKISNVPLIRKHWNCELNGKVFLDPAQFNLTQSYWFICNKGHNFKSSIKDFDLCKCRGCIEHPPNHPSKTQTMEFLHQYFDSFTDVIEYEGFILAVPLLKVAIHLHENDRYKSHRNYFNNEEEMLNEVLEIKAFEKDLRMLGFDFTTFEVEKNFKDNVDKLRNLMVTLVQHY